MKKSLVKTLALSALALFSSFQSSEAKVKVHTIGDSTMADYATDGSTDKRGWCQMLQQFFDSEYITINNRGKSGASSKSFYKEAGYWPTLVKGGSDQMQEGDFLLIQFAHNDEKTNGCDGDSLKAYYTAQGKTSEAAATDYRGTTPYGTYKTYIRAFIKEAKEMGVTPIVVGPICRKYFSGNTIRRNGQHDLGDKFDTCDGTSTYKTGNSLPADNHLMDYVASARDVAAEYDDVPFIDLTTLTEKLYLSYGEPYCTAHLFCKDDNTHPQGEGATLIARAFAQQLIDQAASETDAKKKAVLQALAEHAIVSSEITFNPTSGDLGKAYQGQQIVKEFSVSAFGLEQGASMTITAEGPFQLSTDKATYGPSITIKADGANIITNVYVRASLNNAGTVTGAMTATAGSLTSRLDLTAQCISLTGGTEATAVWPLTSSPSPETSELLTVHDQTLSNLTVKNYQKVGEVMMQRIHTADGTWPAGEIDEVSTRYIEFKATCPADYEYAIDKISFTAAGAGGGTVSYHAYYSLQSDFSSPVLIDEKLGMANGTPQTIEYQLAEQISEGQSIYIRFYPWLNNVSSAATGKYLCLSDLSIHGVATKAGAESFSATGKITYALMDAEPVFDPLELSAGFIGKTLTLGSQVTNGGNVSFVGNQSATLTSILNNTASAWPTSVAEGNTITYTLTPNDGFVFIPSKISFDAARFGTDGGSLTAIVTAGANSQTIVEGQAPNRSGKTSDPSSLKDLSSYEADVNGIAATIDEPLTLTFSVLNLPKSKNYGIGNIVIEGTVTGSASTAKKYSLMANVLPAGAGSIKINPELASYKEGSKVTLSAAPAFGYAFSHWTEADATLSEEASTTITIDRERSLTAVFVEVPVFSISTKATDNREAGLGLVTLSPNDHEGRYETGSEVVATAVESKIMKFVGWTDANGGTVTGNSRSIIVDKDMELVANYEIQDFIAVFDASKGQSYAYATTAGYPFDADIAWDENRRAQCAVVKAADGQPLFSDQSGTPVVRMRETVVVAGENGLYSNGYRSTDIAFQYQFSTIGFENATFTGDIVAKNAASINWKAQISTDGTTFTDIADARWSLSASSPCPIEFELPASAMGQDLVYIRLTGADDEVFKTDIAFDGTFDGLDFAKSSEQGVANVTILGKATDSGSSSIDEIASSSLDESGSLLIFDLQGRRLNDMNGKGVFIIGGKKVIR